MSWYLAALKKYAQFSGRARRMEYWMFLLFNVIISMVLALVEALVGSAGLLGALYSLAVLIPSIAVTIRRLHDIDRSGWWLLILLVPIVGAVVLLVFVAQEGTPRDNAYGPNPKAEPVQQTVAV